jgi:hypothetical protein
MGSIRRPATAPRHVIAVAAFAFACESTLEIDTPYVWDGEHVQVRSDASLDRYCGRTLESVDDLVGEAKRVHEAPDDLVVTSYVLARPLSEYGEVCPKGELPVAGCARETTAYSRLIRHDHELVHAVRDSVGLSPRFFEEGAATFWGGANGKPTVDWELVPIRDAMAAARERFLYPQENVAAAHFTGFLMHSFGVEAHAAFLREVNWNASSNEVEAGFVNVFGVSLDAAIDAYERDWPFCSLESMRLLSDCTGEAIPMPCTHTEVVFPLDHEIEMACDDPFVVGPERGWLWRDIIFEVDTPEQRTLSVYVDDFHEADRTKVTLKRCDTDCALAEPFEIGPNGLPQADVNGPGRYVLRVMRPEQNPATIQFGWRCRP